MIALYIIGGIVLLLAVLLASPVKVYFTYDKSVGLNVGFLFWKIKLLPSDSSAAAKKSDDETAAKKGAFASASEIVQLGRVLLGKVKWIIKRLRIKKMDCTIVVATEDAATTGIEYGAVCSLVYPVLGFIGSQTDISCANVNVVSDFDSKEFDITANIEISLALFYALWAAVSALVQFVKIKIKTNDK